MKPFDYLIEEEESRAKLVRALNDRARAAAEDESCLRFVGRSLAALLAVLLAVTGWTLAALLL